MNPQMLVREVAGTFGLAEAARLRNAVSPPKAKAAIAAITIARSIPGRRRLWLELIDADIFPLFIRDL